MKKNDELKIKDLLGKVLRQEEKLAEKEERIGKLLRKLQECQDRMDDLENKVEVKQALINTLQADLEDKTAKGSMWFDLQLNKARAAMLEDTVRRQQREIDNYKEQISLLERQNSGMLNDYLVKKDKNDFLTKENAELHRKVEKLEEEKKKLEERFKAREEGVPYAVYVAEKAYDEAWNKMADKVLKGTGLYDSMLKAMDLLKSENERLAAENRFYKMKYSGKHCCLSLGCPFLMREDDE